jgi:hypothetical protein
VGGQATWAWFSRDVLCDVDEKGKGYGLTGASSWLEG